MTELSPPPVEPAAPTAGGDFLGGLVRGLRLKCPNCGQGRLYCGYLKVQGQCLVCGNDNAQYRADDAGPYFTILVVGHLAVGPMLFFPFIWKAPLALVIGTTLPTLAILTLALLPRIKGAVIGAQWALQRRREAAAAEPAEAETRLEAL